VPTGLSVRADDHVGVALDHLVENALTYSGDEPTVTVSAERQGGEVVLSVADDGPGIPTVEREVLLGSRPITQLEHGSGIGLYTAKAVAESYGGDIDVTVGDGTTVELRLPAA
jgi:signal transduction histidine kinase